MKRFFCLILLTLLVANVSFAQRISAVFSDTPLPTVLHDIAAKSKTYTLHFIYDDLEDFRVTANIKSKSVPDAVRQAIGFYPVSMSVNEALRTITVECRTDATVRWKGRVTDAEGEPLPYATVSLLSPADSTALAVGVSSESGQFVIPCNTERAIVRVSYVGYETFYAQRNATDVGTLRMKTEANVLKTVTVKTNRPFAVATDQGLLAQVKGTALEKFGSASEMLTHLPLMTDDGQVVGHGTPEIYINNKKVKGTEELDRLRADEIQTAEIITSPGAEYGASVSSVIRINTVKRQGEGWSGNFSAAYQQGEDWNGNVSAALNYRLGNGMDFFAKGFLINTNQVTESTNNDELQASSLWNYDRASRSKFHSALYYADLGWNWKISEQHSVGITYTANNCIGDVTTRTTADEKVWRDGAPIEENHSVTDDNRHPRLRHSVNAYYVGEAAGWKFDFSADYYGARSLSEMSGTTNDVIPVSSVTNTKNQFYAEKLTITAPLRKGTLTFGQEASYTTRQSAFTQSGFSTDNDIRQHTAIWSLYANCSLPITKALTLRAGVRWQNEYNSYRSAGSKNDRMSPDYSVLIPRASLTWRTGKWTHAFSFLTRRDNAPYYLLSSSVDYVNKYRYDTGNPYLKSCDYLRFSFSETWKWLYIEAYRWKATNAYRSHLYAYDDAQKPGVVIMDIRNFNHGQVGMTVSVSPVIGCWRLKYLVDCWVETQDLKPLGITHNWHGLNTYIQLDNTFTLPHDWTLNVTGIIEPYVKTGAAITKTTGNVNFRLNKSLLKDKSLNIAILAKDIFRTRWSKGTDYGGIDYCSRMHQYSDARRVGINISWKFNAAKSRYKGTHAGESERNRL